MRILHMIPDIGISNGILSVILNYAKAMPDDIKFDIVYFADKEETKENEIKALGGRVYKINPPSIKSALKGEMLRFFRKHKGEWSSLHINAPHFTVFIAPAARLSGIKKICCHCHSTLFSLKSENLKRNEILFKLGRGFADKKFACSKAAGDYWYQKNYTVLNNAIDCDSYRFNPDTRERVRQDLKLDDKTVIGHIGRCDVEQKNHPFLFRVFGEIYKNNKNARLMLVGAQPDDKAIALINELGITDAVMFMGLRRDVGDLLQAMDCFVFPSTKEGLPVSVIEAQAAGLGVVMSDSVTDEVMVSENIYALSLNEDTALWADKALGLCSIKRNDNSEIMKAAGWDIYDCAKQLSNYYKNQENIL